jgi:hypothetical protein
MNVLTYQKKKKKVVGALRCRKKIVGGGKERIFSDRPAEFEVREVARD